MHLDNNMVTVIVSVLSVVMFLGIAYMRRKYDR